MRTPLFVLRPPLAAALLSFVVPSILLGQPMFASGGESPAPSTGSHAFKSDSAPGLASSLPDAPGYFSSAAEDGAAEEQRGGEPWEGNRNYGPLSRLGFGANVSPLGIGVNSATILTRYLDARLLVNFFNFNVNDFEIEGFRGNAAVHLFSVGAAVDSYPRNSIWRLSAGLMMHNGNNLSGSGEAVPGQSFSVDGETFYSANANAATGATPLTGSGALGLHAREPEFFVSGGFGRFVPHSERHWSFPSEFGVIFMGAPTVEMTTAGWVCKNTEAGSCSPVSSTAPVSVEFNNALQAQLTKWRNSLSPFSIYPMFSYSVVYSFDVP